jgi:hypothetical protein
MLAYEQSALATIAKLREAAAERRMPVFDLIASAAASEAPSSVPASPALPLLTHPIRSTSRLASRFTTTPDGLRSEIRYETERAWLMTSPVGGETWLPKSQCEHHCEDPVSRAIFIIPNWLARKKGLSDVQ